MDNSNVRDQVREHYAELARRKMSGQGSSCCGSSNAIPADAIQDKDAVPQDVVTASLGCGTPLEIANLQPGETVLDLGSGGGLDCFYAAKKVGPTGKVYGVDMTQDMLDLAHENAKKVGATNVEFRQGYLEDLPLPDASVDVIISNCVVNLSPDKDRVFQEAFRVLKPGGRVTISDMVTRFKLPDVLRSNIDSWAGCVSGAITKTEYLEKMQNAGFIGVAQVAGGENIAEPVYSAKIIAQKPGDVVRLPQGWGENAAAAAPAPATTDAPQLKTRRECCG